MAKLWNKGYDLDREIEQFTVGDDPQTDLKLLKYDILVNKAHAKMLNKIGILTADELDSLTNALDGLQSLAAQGKFMIKQEQEDVHTAVEAFLTEKLGDIGKKIHTARSRNDQVAADLALYQIDSLGDVLDLLKKFVDALDGCAERSKVLPMPGYTHMQKAMPFNVYGWLYGFRELIEDDIVSIGHAIKILDKNPLGSGAGYGVPIEIDTGLTTKELGFSKCFGNPLSVQQSRGKTETSTLSALNQVMLTMNKLATDLMLFTTSEFG
ncbi:argininosuccinate lyase, partial [Candidatus Woesearchaeota archaeon]|nr:argininosuccinate lyase [Candidatus Woesearchaeota archaeon]